MAQTGKSATQDPKMELVDEEVEIMESDAYIEKLVKGWSKLSLFQRIGYSFICILAIGLSLFHIYTSGYGTLPAWQHRAVHLCVGLTLIYILFPFNKKKGFQWFDLIPTLISLALLVFVVVDYPGPELRQGEPEVVDLIVGSLMVVLVVESVRRTNGWAMTLVSIFFIAYIFLGPYFPGLLSHQGYRYIKFIDQMFNGTLGIFGTPLYVSSTVLILFVIWGAFLIRTGAGEFFTELALALTGNKRGGPALAAVVSSAMVGSITGNGAANVVITGAFTIPLMKRIGYKPSFAAAVEAVASQGGQIMPPIMGAAAFIMAEYVGVPYIKVCAYAAIPALGYYLLAGVMVYLEARKQGLGAIPKDQLPKTWEVFKNGFYFLVPIVFIVYMMAEGNSAMKAGFYAILLSIALSFIRKANRLNFLNLLVCLEKGARSGLSVIAACAAAGIIVGAISLTGLGMRFSRFAVEVSGDNLLVLLFMMMIASLVLGMGMPTTPAYIILAVLGAPVLIKMGVLPIAAHLFVFYFGIISGLTPPVAITAYTAAGVAGSDPTETGMYATKLALGGFLLPFMFVYNPALLLQSDNVWLIIQVALTTLMGCIAFATAIQGFAITRLNMFERVAFVIASGMFFHPGTVTDILGLALIFVAAFFHWQRSAKLQHVMQ